MGIEFCVDGPGGGGGAGNLAERWHLHSVGGGNTASKGMGEVFFKIIWVYSNQ